MRDVTGLFMSLQETEGWHFNDAPNLDRTARTACPRASARSSPASKETRLQTGTRRLQSPTRPTSLSTVQTGTGTTSAARTCSGGGMAYYDAYMTQAANTALGRSLATFYTQDDDPTINGSADANLLARPDQDPHRFHPDHRARSLLRREVRAALAVGCELRDVLLHAGSPVPAGGPPESRVNLPSQYLAQAGSGIDRLMMEALSWGSTYRTSRTRRRPSGSPLHPRVVGR